MDFHKEQYSSREEMEIKLKEWQAMSREERKSYWAGIRARENARHEREMEIIEKLI